MYTIQAATRLVVASTSSSYIHGYNNILSLAKCSSPLSLPSSSKLSLLSSHYEHQQFSLFSPPSIKSEGVCRAGQVVELFPAFFPDIVVREARLEDSWEVAETHCSSFFPEYSFPLDFVLRIDRLVAMLSGFSLPNGCKRTCLVAVIGSSTWDAFFLRNEDLKIGGFDGKLILNKGYVTGILTVDTVADFLPRKGPLRKRSLFQGKNQYYKYNFTAIPW
ncbi:hypothetical protein Ancab_001643 [Ancistrocladus abbreviatus]